MKYAILSDLHANASAFKRVLADAEEQGAEKLICLGDIVGYGPLPAETLSLLRTTNSEVLAGNHDDAVSGRQDTADFIGLAGDAVSRHRNALAAGDLDWLKSLPHVLEGDGFIATHGDFTAPGQFKYIESETDAQANFAATSAQLMFVGHTHVPGLFLTGLSGKVYSLPSQDFTLEDGKRYIVNPGSVGYPRERDGKCLSSYVLFDSVWRTVEFRTLPFDVSSLLQRGQDRKRPLGRMIAVTILSAALVGAAIAFTFTRTMTAPEDPCLLVETRTVWLGNDRPLASANLALAKDSPAAILRVRFVDREGAVLSEKAVSVKQSSTKGFRPPKNAARAEFALIQLPDGKPPEIASFKPGILGRQAAGRAGR